MRHRRPIAAALALALTATLAAQQAVPVNTTVTGTLEPGDGTLPSGEHRDLYTFPAEMGHRYQIDVRSDAFDAYVIHRTPGGAQIDDNNSGGGRHAQLSAVADATGPATVCVTSAAPAETGAYTLVVTDQGGGGVVNTGSLAEGDQRLPTGEFVDHWRFEVAQGQRYRIEVRSAEFDTVAIYQDPAGAQQTNDDGPRGTDSALTITAQGTGSAVVGVTSFTPGETGAYTLTFEPL